MFEYGEDEIDPIGKLAYFSEADHNAVFQVCCDDMFYVFSKTDFNSCKSVFVDFGQNRIPDKYRRDYHEIEENGYNYIYSTPILCNDYIALDVSVGEYMETYVYDGRKEESFTNSPETMLNSLLIPLCSYGNRFIAAIMGQEEYEALIEEGFNKAPDEIERHLKADGAALVFYEMK